MQYDEVARHFHRVPFRPLRIRMVSGQEYKVRTPESIVSRRYAGFLVERDIIETVALEYIEAIAPLGKNGARRR
mgnify:CR=1 FL=1